jgi:ATP-dependent RNA helicase RhlE
LSFRRPPVSRGYWVAPRGTGLTRVIWDSREQYRAFPIRLWYCSSAWRTSVCAYHSQRHFRRDESIHYQSPDRNDAQIAIESGACGDFSIVSFSDLGLSAELLRAVEKLGYSQSTPIQQQAIPFVLEGRDVLASAQTGTGKTAGFMLPLLQRLQTGPRPAGRKGPRALVLTPTRELAAQVAQSAKDYGQYLRARVATIYGGVSINPQIAALRQGVDIVVATPGRLLDHQQQRTIDLSGIEILVLDEADRMLDMGFIRDIRRILALLPKQRQTLLFSATFSSEIRALAAEFLRQPAEVSATPPNSAVERVEQVVWPVDRERKRELLSHRIGSGNWRQVLVFTRTKHGADRLTRQLGQDGLDAVAIHGRKSQNARTRALADFKAGKVRVLVATDIAARGLDIQGLPHVVNFELPDVPEDYLHRIGRTARAGLDGKAVSLVCVDELKLLQAIERLQKLRIPQEVVPGYEVDPRIRPEPIERGGQRRSNQPRTHQSRNNQPRSNQASRAPRPSKHRRGGRGNSGAQRSGR